MSNDSKYGVRRSLRALLASSSHVLDRHMAQYVDDWHLGEKGSSLTSKKESAKKCASADACVCVCFLCSCPFPVVAAENKT